jgi:shikimate dehydrogenase
MKTYGLIGFPLSHSFSQKYFTDKFSKEKIDARYLNFPIESISELPGLLKQHPYLAGLNVTIPYKQQIIPFLNELDAETSEIGAVNVVKITWANGQPILKGYNSDVKGFTRSLEPLLKPVHNKALILGTGGASRAVAHGLLKLGILYRLVSRNPQGPSHVSYNDLTPEIISEYKLIINTSPVGMYPNVDQCPTIPYEAISDQHVVFDLVYNPEQTLLMQKSAAQGATVKNGLEMLHLQAEEAWHIWNS